MGTYGTLAEPVTGATVGRRRRREGLRKGIMYQSNIASCQHCDSPGGEITLQNQVCMPLNGRVQCIDFCIHQIVAALNAGGIHTTFSCCGHGEMKGAIKLEDGRVLFIQKEPETDEAWKKALAL